MQASLSIIQNVIDWLNSRFNLGSNPQTISVEVAPGVLEKREVVPGWDNPVTFSSS